MPTDKIKVHKMTKIKDNFSFIWKDRVQKHKAKPLIFNYVFIFKLHSHSQICSFPVFL